jgi:hypothetical protein
VVPLAQAFSTFITGMPLWPTAPTTFWPAVDPWPTWPHQAASTASKGRPASLNASRIAQLPRSMTVFSSWRANGVIPTPTT